MRELSVFVDESGDFGDYAKHSPYYVVTMVFHDQTIDISKQIDILNENLLNMGYDNVAVHTEPLIRREEIYKNVEPNERRALFSKLYYFVLHTDIAYKSFVYEKIHFDDINTLQAADLICTLVLLQKRYDANKLTRSDILLFRSRKNLKKDFLKRIKEKEF